MKECKQESAHCTVILIWWKEYFMHTFRSTLNLHLFI